MTDGQKRNIPLGGYGKVMSLGLRPRDIPMPYPPHGILHFYPSAMWSCYNISSFDYSLQTDRSSQLQSNLSIATTNNTIIIFL